MNLKQFHFIAFIVICFFSCSKEKDNFRPTIHISSPTHLQNINGVDTIQIVAEFKDDQNLESIQVFLKDENDNVVLSSINQNPNTKTFSLNEWFFFDDIHLPSGRYYFSFKAFDGKNTTLETVDIWYDEQPKSRNGFFIADNNGNSTTITYLDNLYTATYYNNYLGDFLKLSVNSFEQKLLISPSNLGNITSVNLKTGSVAWTDNPTAKITGFYANTDYNFFGFNDGIIKRYGQNGTYNFHGNASTNFFIEEATEHENYLVMEQKELSTNNVKLVLSWLHSGAQVQQATINEDILGIYTLDANQLVLITNNSIPQGNLIFYYFSTGLTNSPFSINTGKIDACVEISTGKYLIAENGNLTEINAGSFSKVPYLTGINANLLKYDYYTNELMVINGSQLTIYDYSYKSIKGNFTHSSSILDLDFWYNK